MYLSVCQSGHAHTFFFPIRRSMSFLDSITLDLEHTSSIREHGVAMCPSLRQISPRPFASTADPCPAGMAGPMPLSLSIPHWHSFDSGSRTESCPAALFIHARYCSPHFPLTAFERPSRCDRPGHAGLPCPIPLPCTPPTYPPGGRGVRTIDLPRSMHKYVR